MAGQRTAMQRTAKLRELHEQEREILSQMRRLIDKLDEEAPYRAILERHLGKFQETVASLETLAKALCAS